jgi:isopentenyl-diphosphate delta-isomerase
MIDSVILVDTNDREIGTEEKLKAHQEGKLHRAFSVLLFNDKKELLLQQRALSKYHSGGLWTNACCSHPRPQEDMISSVRRRLNEELLIPTSETIHIKKIDSFIYFVELENGLIEHELDYLYIGYYPKTPEINKEEAMDYRWNSLDSIKNDIKKHPETFSFWFKEIISQFCNQIEEYINESLQKRNI